MLPRAASNTKLAAECIRYNLFDEAIAEVLDIMEVNFKADFERTREYQRLNRAVEREAKELAVLRQVCYDNNNILIVFILVPLNLPTFLSTSVQRIQIEYSGTVYLARTSPDLPGRNTSNWLPTLVNPVSSGELLNKLQHHYSIISAH